MEVLGVIIVLGLIGYAIYINTSNYRYEIAKNLLNKRDFHEAKGIFLEIYEKHKEAPISYPKCQLALMKAAPSNARISFLKDIAARAKSLPRGVDQSAYSRVNDEAHIFFFEKKYDNIKASDSLVVLKTFLKEIENFKNKSLNTRFNKIKSELKQKIGVLVFNQGLQLEGKMNFEEANEKYSEAASLFKVLRNMASFENAVLRGNIVSLKLGSYTESNQLNFENGDSVIKDDYYFRLAHKYCFEKQFTRAQEIVENHLNDAYPGVIQLKHYIDYQTLDADLQEVDVINEKVAQLLSSKETQLELVLDLYNRTKCISTSTVFGEIREATEKLLPSLFNRLFTSRFNEGWFKEALDLICEYDEFWTKPELLKNAGVCAYNIIHENKLILPEINEIISIWLSSVFNDRVLINSLDKTAWDDAYSFTLIDSLGSSSKSLGRLPSNVNFGEIDEENISIGAAQRELLNRFELMLVAKQEQGLLEIESLDFYHSEKAAIENLIKVVDDKNFKPAPSLAKTHGLNEEIVEVLSSLYNETKDEGLLRCGVPYLESPKSSKVSSYAQALKLSEVVIERFKSGLSISKTQLNSITAISALKTFNTLSIHTETRVINAFNNFSEEVRFKKSTMDNLAFYIDSFSSNSKCKSLYAKTLAEYTVREVNDDKMSYLEALTLLRKAYRYVPNHQRVCQNMAFLIKALLYEYINEELRGVKKFKEVLDSLKTNISEELKRECYILKEARDSIIEQFISSGNTEGLTLIMTGSYQLSASGRKFHEAFKYFDAFSGTESDLGPTNNLFGLF